MREQRKLEKQKEDFLGMALMLKMLYDSCVEVGFNEKQAFTMVTETLKTHL